MDTMHALRAVALLRRAAWVLLAVAAAAVAWSYLRLPASPGAPPAPPPPGPWPEPAVFTPADGQVFRAAAGAPAADGDAAGRLRLAGTFLTRGESDAPAAHVRKAILDDLAEQRQYLVDEGDTVASYRVWRILDDRVIVTRAGRDTELLLGFLGRGGPEAAAGTAPGAAAGDGETAGEPPALSVSRYGRRVGEDRWVLRREAMVEYYREMLDHPERVARLYETFKPLYRSDGGITGYRVGIEGEKDFLDAMGLMEGDQVRAVNSLNMTSQSRAEYFIGEFLRGDLNAIVVDIERGGAAKKLVYLVR